VSEHIGGWLFRHAGHRDYRPLSERCRSSGRSCCPSSMSRSVPVADSSGRPIIGSWLMTRWSDRRSGTPSSTPTPSSAHHDHRPFPRRGMNRKIRFISFYRTAAYVTMAVSTSTKLLFSSGSFDPSYASSISPSTPRAAPSNSFFNSPSEGSRVIVVMDRVGMDGIPASSTSPPSRIPNPCSTHPRWTGPARGRRSGGSPPVAQPGLTLLAVWLTINALQP